MRPLLIAASASPGEIRLAVQDGAILIDYAIWRPGAPDGLGDLHWARITARVPAMAGAFAALATGADGFLPDSAGAAGRTQGDLLAVRIVRTAQGGKGPRLAAATPPPGTRPATAPALIAAGPTPLARLAAAYPGAAIQIDSPLLYAALRATIPGLALVPRAFDDALEAELDALATPHADLPGGLRATITPTPALAAIDVDMAGASAGGQEKHASQFAANRAALPALARQIRLRNLSGAILIDLAGIQARRRAALAPDLAAALAPDPAQPRLLGFTALGLAEILRPRLSAPLHELLAGPHAAGLAALRAAAGRPAAGRPAAALALRAAPSVIAALQADPAALQALAHATTHALILRSDPNRPVGGWVLEDAT